MRVQREHRKTHLRSFLQHCLHSRMAASSGAILAALLCSTNVAAESRVWLNGSAFDPAAHIINNLPVPVTGTTDVDSWIQSGEITDAAGKPITSVEQFSQLLDGDKKILRIDQKSGKLILNWKSFDIGEQYTVDFHQPTSTSLALNQIGASDSPSYILGNLNANGGVYLVNPNGIIFGKNSQVNVGSLVASSLDIDSDLFVEKSLGKAMTDEDKAAFFIDQNSEVKGNVVKFDSNGNLKEVAAKDVVTENGSLALRGDIAILNGAKINSTTLNGVVAVAPNVLNEGTIKTPDGQTILAAAQDEAFVLFSNDPNLRGLLIEVNTGGNVTNLGNIIAERGNVTLAGIAVNHSGTIKATTSVDFNGTVRLIARDTLVKSPSISSIDQVSALLDSATKPNDIVKDSDGNNLYRVAQHGGDVTIGKAAVIDVSPELESQKTAPDAQVQRVSGVEIAGNTIRLQENSSINAKGGKVFLEATDNLNTAFDSTGYTYTLPSGSTQQPSRIVLDTGSKIDVSGVEVDLPMERNVIEVELRSNELADSPLQRGGFLNGKKVLVDVRKGTPLADISAALAAVPKQVGERLTQGGSIQLRSAGEVIVQPNASLDVSGGGIHYAAGYVQTTNLISEGKVINIADADPSRIYTGILGTETATNKRFNITETFKNSFQGSDRGDFVEAFDQGDSAGSITLQAQAASFQGTIQAGAFIGPDQRTPGKTNSPDGGTLNLEVNLQSLQISQLTSQLFDVNKLLLKVVDSYKGLTVNPNGLFAADTLDLSHNLFNQSGLSHYNLTARNGSATITSNTDLHLADGASLSLFAADQINVDGYIQSTGGKISLATGANKGVRDTNLLFVPATVREDVNRPIHFGSNASINTSGTWINDNPLLAGNETPSNLQAFIDAGAVSIKAAGDLLLDAGSAIIANGGGWINRLGSFVSGKGGNITLSGIFLDPPSSTTTLTERGAHLDLSARLSSYAFSQGGELNITAPSIVISDQAVNENSFSKETLLLDSRFFQRGGFSSYNLTAQGSKEWISNFSFAEFIDITPRTQNYAKGASDFTLSSNSALAVLPTGSNLQQVLGVAELPDYERKAVNLSFKLADKSDFSLHDNGVRDNNFIIPTGVRFFADPKSTIGFTSNTSLVFDGIIKDQGGSVNFTLQDHQSSNEIDLANFDDVGIWLGSNSVIDVSSTFIKNPPSTDGLTNVGKVVDAGSVNLAVDRGFILTEKGSLIDISAKAYATERYVSSDELGAHIETTMQAAQAGKLSLKAAEGILFDGDVNAQGAGYGALGGTFNVELSRSENQVPQIEANSPFLDSDYFSNISFANRTIELVQQLVDDKGNDIALIPDGLLSVDLGKKGAISNDKNGKAIFSVGKLANSGFDSYAFTSGYITQPNKDQLALIKKYNPGYSQSSGIGQINFEGDVAFVAGRSIDFNTTTLSANNGRGLVVAPYIKVGMQDGISQNGQPKFNSGKISGGNGELVFAATNLSALGNAGNVGLETSLLKQKTTDILPLLNSPTADGLLNLVGNIATQGADNVTLASAGDIRSNGLLIGDGKGNDARYLGSFSVFNNLTLQADQIYPSTLSEFIFSSGQYNLSAAGTAAISLSNKLNLVDAIQFTVQYTDSDGNLQTKTELATEYEAYDVIAGKLGVGGSIIRSPDQSTQQTETIVSINNNKIQGNPNGKVTVLSGGKTSSVLSAAGTLIFDAPNIDQGGVVKAPLGRIVFNTQGANSSVVMREGSTTSVSAENTTIPFGELDASDALIYKSNPLDSSLGVRLFNESPEATVVINSANVDLQKGATVDLSGGGDLLAYRFVPGPGGSKDVLAAANSGQSFVILPSLNSQYTPYDPSIINESTSNSAHIGKGIGEKVYLSGTGNLPAGEYTILPARYALLPGAYLVTPVADGQVYSEGQQVRRVDGTPVVAGRFVTANTGEYDSQLSGFVVEPGSIARTRSEYVVTTASELFKTDSVNSNHKNTPNDAASLVVLAGKTLNMEAKVVANVGNKGLGAQLDIASDNLLITDKAVADSDAVQVITEQLTGFDSILLGGRRTSNSDGSYSITAEAQQVKVEKNTVLTAPNILLAARGTDSQHKGKVILDTGAKVIANGAYQQQAEDVTFYGDALLSVSSGKQIDVTQQSSTTGDLLISTNASVQANKGSVLLLSNAETQLDGDIVMQGGALDIGAGHVSLGQVDNNVTGLKFTNDDLAKLTVDELKLTSASTIDFFGSVNLNFADLTLQANGFRGFGSANNSATLTAAHNLQIRGNTISLPADSNVLGVDLGNGSLTLSADVLTLGKGNLFVAGFDQINWNAVTAFVGEDSSNIRIFDNKTFNINTPLLTGSGASNTQLRADGLVTVQSSGVVSEKTIKTYSGLGSRLAISGQSLEFIGNVLLPSGELTLSALGDHNENISIRSGSVVDVSGRAVVFDDTTVASNGGSIHLNSNSGNVQLDTGAKLNISGVPGSAGSDAGKLSVNALAGQVVLDGTINATSGTGSKGGSLELVVKNIADFSKLIQQVDAGNFTEAFSLRVNSGDLLVKDNEELSARYLSLTTDSGNISIAGAMNASGISGESGGQITLNASKDINLQSTAKLLAASTVSTKGGDVLLSSSNGFINVSTGAHIDVTGGGTVTFRAPRTQNGTIITANQIGDDVAITLQGATLLSDVISGAKEVNVDAFKIYNVIAATSEIFNTSAIDGSSTVSEAFATMAYLTSVPFGAVCNLDAGCGNFIKADSNYNPVILPSVAKGELIPVGSLCGDTSGCSYSYKINDSASSIANVETKTFMQNAEQMEKRLFGSFSLKDIFHVKPELELRSTSDITVDEAIDFGEGLGIINDLGGGFLGYANDGADVGSSWRYNDELIKETVYDPNAGDYVEYDRYANGESGVLSLRAQGNIVFDAPVSDGFTKAFSYGKFIATSFVDGIRTELSNEVHGWNYHWVAGADLSSANAMAVGQSGQLTIANDVVLRTSTGNIEIATAGNLLMGSNSALYTAGRATGKGVYDDLINTGFDQFDFSVLANANYATDGGHIVLNIGNDITSTGTQQFVTDWLQRAGGQLTGSITSGFPNSGYLPTTWAIVYEHFKQGIATLGGGDIQIDAGGGINNLAVSLPTTGKNTSEYHEDTNTISATTKDNVLIQGGGDLSVSAGGDILSGQFYVARGKADINAGGDIVAAKNGNATLLEIADSQMNISAAGTVSIASIINPTVARLSAYQTGSSIYQGASAGINLSDYDTSFFTYSNTSKAVISALSGDVNFINKLTLNESSAVYVTGGGSTSANTNIYPAQLQARALQGDINIENTGITLFPSAEGKLSLLAANNISTASNAAINMPDSDLSLLPSIINPMSSVPTDPFALVNLAYLVNPALTKDKNDPLVAMHALTPLYINNADPVRIVAQNGDISNIRLVTPTHAWVSAGRDINNIIFEFQNVHEGDVSIVKAGRDIVFATPRNSVTNIVDATSATQGIDIAGFGRLDVIAGGDIALGASRGIASIGAKNNPNLLKNGFSEESGADISLLAGIKTAPNYSGFIDSYLSDFTSLEGITTSNQLISYAVNYDTSTRASAEKFIKTVGGITHRDYFSGAKVQNLSDQEINNFVNVARKELQSLPPVQQQLIAFHLNNSRGDNYTGDLIEFVTSPRFGGERLDATKLLAMPLEVQHAAALAAFKAAPVSAQRELILQAYNNEVKQGGIQDVSGNIDNKDIDGFARSYAAIQSLFPQADTTDAASPTYAGNINLIFSTVQTLQGGDINLIAPGGGIDVGVAAIGGGVSKDPSKLGLIALRSGSVNATVNNNINVNSSRVFALDGGDILLWSSTGNIDAGRGAKSALSVPPPVINDDGSINFQAAVAGSGIRNSRFTQDRSPGAVYLFAPTGVVNAGDAGIGSQGDVLIAAQQVIGADNIDVGGVSIGIPVTTGVSAGVATAGSSTTSATDAAAKDSLGGGLAEALDQRNAAFVTVDLLGFDF